MQILVSEAAINTVAVEVKTLKVKSRQVTLALFRQIKAEFPEPRSNPVLWGHVNYHPDKCSDEREHMHVVWQKGSELRRATVYKKPQFHCDYVYLEALLKNCKAGKSTTHPFRVGRESGIVYTNQCGQFQIEQTYLSYNNRRDISAALISMDTAKAHLDKHYTDAMRKDFDSLVDRGEWHNRVWSESLKTPQLFIAV